MGRDTDTIEEETNGQKNEVQYITENQMINHKLDLIIRLLTTKS